MKYFTLFSIIIFLLFAVQFSQAQTVDEVISKYETARGGKDKLLAVKSIYMEGSRTMMGNDIMIRLTKEQDKLSRTEFDMAGGTGFFLVTDKEGWMLIPMRSPDPAAMPAPQVAAAQTELDIAGPLVDYAAKGHKTELVGKDSANGVACFKIKLTSKAGKEIFYWIDAGTYLLVQSSQKVEGGRNGGVVEMTTVYSDYKEIDGVKFPQTIEQKGGQAGTTIFDKIELNKPVDPKLYKP
jgi:hypothetical protein